MTAGEVAAYLRETGFVDISTHSRKDSLDPEIEDEELVFLGVRPRA